MDWFGDLGVMCHFIVFRSFIVFTSMDTRRKLNFFSSCVQGIVSNFAKNKNPSVGRTLLLI